MKLTQIIIALFFLVSSTFNDSPNDFDYNLSGIARRFETEIMDEDKCKRLKWEAYELAEDIEYAITKGNTYNNDELIKLKELKKEAEALGDLIAAVGNCGISIITPKN